MKKLGILACLIAALAVTVSAAQAAVVLNDKTDIAGGAFVPCANGGAGEVVFVEGTLHTLIATTVNGNNASVKFHQSIQGSGTGLTTGDKYQYSSVSNQTQKVSLQNAQVTLEFVARTKITGQGPDNNLYARSTFHVTLNANGDVTSSHSDFTFECG